MFPIKILSYVGSKIVIYIAEKVFLVYVKDFFFEKKTEQIQHELCMLYDKLMTVEEKEEYIIINN